MCISYPGFGVEIHIFICKPAVPSSVQLEILHPIAVTQQAEERWDMIPSLGDGVACFKSNVNCELSIHQSDDQNKIDCYL